MANLESAFRWVFYCNECGKSYRTNTEFRCICNPCAQEMGMPLETVDNPMPGFFGDYGPDTNPPAIDSKKVDDAVEQAASEACDVLDKVFPGWDNGGITSNFQGHLANHIRAMLLGKDHAHLTTSLPLPVLVREAAQ